MFAEFVNKFLKTKTEASGWPSWCVDEATKQKLLYEVKEGKGIQLDASNTISNPLQESCFKVNAEFVLGKVRHSGHILED